MLAETFGWSLAPGREGLSGLPNDEKTCLRGFAEGVRIIHYVPWQHPSLLLQHLRNTALERSVGFPRDDLRGFSTQVFEGVLSSESGC